MEQPTTLYHYSNAPGLHGIIISKTLWATHRYFLNDRTEITYTQELVEQIHNDFLKKASEFYDPQNEEYNLNFRGLLHRLSYKTRRPKPNPDIYVISFCEDNDLLSQWRGYGENGSGYAIGFQTKSLTEIDTDFHLRQVIYSEEKQLEILNEILLKMISSYRKSTEGMTSEEMHKAADSHALKFEEEVANIATFFKNPSFHEEKEWRLVCSNGNGIVSSENINYRSGGNGIIPYIKLGGKDKDKRNILPICNINVGPITEINTAIKAVTMLTKPLYPNIRICSSKIPLK